MNKVILTGKIQRIKEFEKVIYATICVRQGSTYEFVPVTIFQTDFFKRYFYEKKWIQIEGHIHINNHENRYETEIIADEMNMIGEISEEDRMVEEAFKEYRQNNQAT